jgi:hypothetical protein
MYVGMKSQFLSKDAICSSSFSPFLLFQVNPWTRLMLCQQLGCSNNFTVTAERKTAAYESKAKLGFSWASYKPSLQFSNKFFFHGTTFKVKQLWEHGEESRLRNQLTL